MTGSTVEMRNQRGGVNRVLAKLQAKLEEGNFYEAHQLYKTLYFRYIAQKKFDEILNLLFEGSQKLIAKGQETSAADLGILIVDTLEKYGSENGSNTENEIMMKSWIERIGCIIAQLKPSVERDTLIRRALAWSGDVSENSLGHPALHKLIAQTYWCEKNMEMARHHYLLCRDGSLCGRVLIKISTKHGYKSEVDLFIAQAVLQQLCLKETDTAMQTFQTYTANHPKIKQLGIPFYMPLLNFLYFLLLSIETGRLDSFRTLCKLYKPTLNRDPAFEKYLSKIGMLFFNAAPRSSGGMFGGLFGDIFSHMFQDLDGDDDEHNERQQTSNVRERSGVSDRLQQDLD